MTAAAIQHAQHLPVLVACRMHHVMRKGSLSCTCLPCLQAELDYYLYWATVYHSKLPFFKTQAQFIKDVIKIRVWKLGYQTDTSVQVAQSYSEACRIEDCTYVLQPVVARRLPVPPPLGADLKLKPSEKSTLVTAVGDAQTFKVGVCAL